MCGNGSKENCRYFCKLLIYNWNKLNKNSYSKSDDWHCQWWSQVYCFCLNPQVLHPPGIPTTHLKVSATAWTVKTRPLSPHPAPDETITLHSTTPPSGDKNMLTKGDATPVNSHLTWLKKCWKKFVSNFLFIKIEYFNLFFFRSVWNVWVTETFIFEIHPQN